MRVRVCVCVCVFSARLKVRDLHKKSEGNGSVERIYRTTTTTTTTTTTFREIFFFFQKTSSLLGIQLTRARTKNHLEVCRHSSIRGLYVVSTTLLHFYHTNPQILRYIFADNNQHVIASHRRSTTTTEHLAFFFAFFFFFFFEEAIVFE